MAICGRQAPSWSTEVDALSPRDAYRLWSPDYEEETAISWIEDRLVAGLTPPLGEARLLDAGCGTGRRLRAAGARSAVGVDASPEMLGIGRAALAGRSDVALIEADVRSMPVESGAFDAVWCRLMIGHVSDPRAVLAELARTAAPGATVIVTDFHEEAVAAGHRRSFRAGDGNVHEIAHWVHPAAVQQQAARLAGLQPVATLEGRIGPEVLPFYRRAGREALYEAHCGLAVVLACAYRREG